MKSSVLAIAAAALLAAPALADDHDWEFRLGITAHYGLHTVRLAAVCPGEPEARQRCATAADAIRPLLGEHLVYEGDESLAERVGQDLLDAGTTLALAESCTGGMIAAQLTDVAGISAAFLGGLVTSGRASR